MLTVRYDWLDLEPGDRVLDLGCGAGRHAFEAARRGARVVAFDHDLAELKDVAALLDAIGAAGEVPPDGSGNTVGGDAGRLPFPDGVFDRVIAAEILEHLPDDRVAVAELARVLRPGGTMAVTVPAWLAERVCWALSDEYHAPFVDGGHVRIYTTPAVRDLLRGGGLVPGRSHHAHALHTPYWWLRCVVPGGPANDGNALVRAYHRVLVWDIEGRRGVSTVIRIVERVANPVLGKSVVLYATKPPEAADVPG